MSTLLKNSLCTRDQLSQILNIDSNSVRKLLRDHHIPVRKFGRAELIEVDDLLKLLEKKGGDNEGE